MSELIENLESELYSWFENENHLDLQIAGEDDFSKPHLWFRFLEDVMNFNTWYAVELRHLEEKIDSEQVQHFVAHLPKGNTVARKIMVSKVGFTPTAIVKAGEWGVDCITFAQDERSRYYGYLIPEVKNQTIDTPTVLSQREWNQLLDHLADSRQQNAAIEALIVDPQNEHQYKWDNLERALPIITPYETLGEYVYDFKAHELHLTGFDILPIEGVVFKYQTTFKPLDGQTEEEALAEAIEQLVK
ncbi:MAG: hypothetical protein AB8E82_00040 [Aureispira sp.]